MNWGHKITIVLILFVIGMGGMVYIASMQTNEMMDDDYYEKEMKFQSLIDASTNLKAITKASLILQHDGQVEVVIPAAICKNITNGTIELLRNNDKLKDLDLTLQTDSSGRQKINVSLLTKGLYKARVKWENNGKLYYYEENIFIEI